MDRIKSYFKEYITPIDDSIAFNEDYFKETKIHSNSLQSALYHDPINQVHIDFYSRLTFCIDDYDVFYNVTVGLKGKIIYRNEHD